MTPSMVLPTVEDEEEYLGRLPSEPTIIRASRLGVRRRRIESITRAKAPIRKMNGKKPYWV
jgi:hypothetical protein